ncbi:flagellar hook-basal body complex protein [Cereibacter sphaeroides f. sp. denitrificans]
MSTNAMHVASTGLNAQQTRMQVISNNLANVNTTGFKRDRANFESLLYQTWKPGGAQTSEATAMTSPSAVGTGVRVVSTEKLYTQGSLANTGNALDLAIDGPGFFQVLMPDGRMGYTRNGTFSQNAEGTITTPSGYVVQPEIQIPEGAVSVTISSDGIVSVLMPDETEAQEVAVETAASGEAVIGNPVEPGFGKLVQGSLEASNVNVVQELVDMIETQRAYEVNSKSISASDEMMQYLANKL